MSFVVRFLASVLLTIALLAFCVPASHAAYLLSFQEVGPDVVATGSGSFDTTDLGQIFSANENGHVEGLNAYVGVGPTDFTPIDVYGSVFGPTSLGSGGFVTADSGSGPIVSLVGASDIMSLPQGYVSDTVLATSTDTYNSSTFATLGLTPGTYDYTWGSDSHTDTFTIQIGVPLPAGAWAALLAIPLAFLARKRLLAV